MYKHKANQLKKKSQIQFAVVSSPVSHMTPVSKLSLQLPKKNKKKNVNKQVKLYSTTMYTASQVKWRELV